MKKLSIKAVATTVVILVAVAVTFAPNLSAGDSPLGLNPDPEGGVEVTCPAVGNCGCCHEICKMGASPCKFTGKTYMDCKHTGPNTVRCK